MNDGAANSRLGSPAESTRVEELVRAEKLKLLFAQSFPAVAISMFTAILLTTLLWEVAARPVLLIWLIAIVAAGVMRLALFLLYRRNHPQRPAEVMVWERPYFISLLVSSLIWGIGGILIMPEQSPVHQMLIYYVLIGMSGGAISVYSAHRVMMLTTVASVLLPVTLVFLLRGELLWVGAAIGGLVFFGSAVRSAKVLAQALHSSLQLTHELQSAKEEAERLAQVDELTGLANRRAFYVRGEELLRFCSRNRLAISLILLDLDRFKSINDSRGHAAGDAALKQVGAAMRRNLRSSDLSGRMGGEEFAVLLPGTKQVDAAGVAEKLRAGIAELPIELASEVFSITASLGVAGGVYDLDRLLRSADEALYRAKAGGRNRVEVAPRIRSIPDPHRPDPGAEGVSEDA